MPKTAPSPQGSRNAHSSGLLGHAAGCAVAVVMFCALTATESQGKADAPTLTEISALTPVECRGVYQGLLAQARASGRPLWLWADEDVGAPKLPSALSVADNGVAVTPGLTRTVATVPSDRRPAPYAVASDATAVALPDGACRFASNTVHAAPKAAPAWTRAAAAERSAPDWLGAIVVAWPDSPVPDPF